MRTSKNGGSDYGRGESRWHRGGSVSIVVNETGGEEKSRRGEDGGGIKVCNM